MQSASSTNTLCCGSVSFSYESGSGSGSCSRSDQKLRIYQPFFLLFLLFKIYVFHQNITFFFVIYEVNNFSVKLMFDIFEKKMYDILMILVDFCGSFPWFWLSFCNPENETDPNQKHSLFFLQRFDSSHRCRTSILEGTF